MRAQSRTTPTPVTAAMTTAIAAPPATPMSTVATGVWPSCHHGVATRLKATSPAHQPTAVQAIQVYALGVPGGSTSACAVPMLVRSTAPSNVAATTTPPEGQVDQVPCVAEGNMPNNQARPAAVLVATTHAEVLNPGSARRNTKAWAAPKTAPSTIPPATRAGSCTAGAIPWVHAPSTPGAENPASSPTETSSTHRRHNATDPGGRAVEVCEGRGVCLT